MLRSEPTSEFPATPLRLCSDEIHCRDNAQLEKMRQLGMKPEDEYKLSAMREYISKLAVARQS